MVLFSVHAHADIEPGAGLAGKSLEDISYMHGWEAAMVHLGQGLRPAMDGYGVGFSDGLAGRGTGLSEADAQNARDGHQSKVARRLVEFSSSIKSQGDVFRAEFAKKPGVRELKEGFLYRFIEEGSGGLPENEVTIKVAFNSYIPGFGVVNLAPRHEQPLNLLIQAAPFEGMQMAARMLKHGSKLECVISPELAYGEEGRGGFPPSATIVMTIQREKSKDSVDTLVFENPYRDLARRAPRVIDMAYDISYLLGFESGQRVYIPGIRLSEAGFLRGFSDAVSAKPVAIDAESAKSALQAQQNWIDARKREIADEVGPLAAAFMQQTAARDDVLATPSGLLYRIISKGEGPLPKADTFVRIACEARLFNASERIELWPVAQPMNALISEGLLPGLLEGLKMMPIGSEYEFFVPSHLAFGAEGASNVPPGAALVLKVNLFSAVDG